MLYNIKLGATRHHMMYKIIYIVTNTFKFSMHPKNSWLSPGSFTIIIIIL